MPSDPDYSKRPRHPASVRAARRALFPEESRPLLERLREILCEPTRAKIMRALTTTRLTVGDLAQVIDRSESSTSRHLRVLRELGVVRSRRSGRMVFNEPADGPLADATREVLGTLAEVAVP